MAKFETGSKARWYGVKFLSGMYIGFNWHKGLWIYYSPLKGKYRHFRIVPWF